MIEPAQLINTFLSATASDFAFLKRDPHFRWTVRLRHTTPAGFVDTSVEQINGVFLASAEFANQSVVGEVTFGDKEYSVEIVVGPARQPVRYGLWEWAAALDRSNLASQNTDFVLTVPRLEAIVSQMASGLEALEASVAAAEPDVLERIERARALAREKFTAGLREDEHRRTVGEAAVAFRAGDYRRVVALLDSVRDDLTGAERQKLSFARKHL